MTEDHCTGERCTCNATGCPYVCSGPTIESTWPNEARMSEDERAIYAAGLWRAREAILAYTRASGRPAWEVCKLIMRFRALDHEASVSFERLRESFAIVRTRGGVAGYQPVRVHYSYESLRALLAERKRPTWANTRRARLAKATPQDRRPPYPWARCAL